MVPLLFSDHEDISRDETSISAEVSLPSAHMKVTATYREPGVLHSCRTSGCFAHFEIQFRITSKWLDCVGTQMCIDHSQWSRPERFGGRVDVMCDVAACCCSPVLELLCYTRGGDAGGCGCTPQDRHTGGQDLCPPVLLLLCLGSAEAWGSGGFAWILKM